MPGRCPLCNAEAEVEQQCGGSKASTLVSHLLDVHGYMRCEICDGEVYIDKTSIPTHIHNPQQPVHLQQQHVHVQQQDAQIPQIQVNIHKCGFINKYYNVSRLYLKMKYNYFISTFSTAIEFSRNCW